MLLKLKQIAFYIICLISKKFYFSKLKSQNNNSESEYINSIDKYLKQKRYFEIGFSFMEFNCSNLLKKNFKGYLIDVNKKDCIIIWLLNKVHNLNLRVKNILVDKINTKKIVENISGGIFSIDIDGNDYWILKEVLKYNNSFEVIIVEYNASFLDLNISVKYEKNFDRHKKHETGYYHGASLNAFIKLLNLHGYCLIKTIGGLNAFFIKKEILNENSLEELSFQEAYQESELRNMWSSTNAQQQYSKIKHLDFVEV